MPEFAITIIDGAGQRRALRESAADEPAVRARLRAQGFWPVNVQPARSSSKLSRLKIPMPEFLAFLHQLELQLRAGVTADAAIAQLAEDVPTGPMRTMLGKIHEDIAQGIPIHAACRFFSRQFPPHLAAVIAAGEASARLPESLKALAANLSSAAELKRTARRALIYPGIVLIATTGLIIFLLGGVVPQFAAIFESLHLPLPGLTLALIHASEAVRAGWPVMLAGIFAAGIGLWVAAHTPRLRYFRDAALLRVPVIGETIRCIATARFAAHCRLLHEAGIPMLEALETGAELSNHAVLARQLLAAREGVAAGKPLYAALPHGHAFPGFIVPALKAGETTGQLGAALHHIEDYAGERARERLATALALLEPLLLATLTAIVGGIALSFFLPIFSLLGGANHH
ncbi:MAG: type II secretion system F family protein [Opitutaceae bacterium]|nr:type II secretion system F family protein [Opitutaceae bacterium]